MAQKTQKTQYPRAQAEVVALALISALEESCERIEVAGSIRRGRPEVGDIELLCVSNLGAYLPVLKPAEAQATFDWEVPDSTSHNLPGDTRFDPEYPSLDVTVQNLINAGQLAKRPNKNGSFSFGVKNKLLVHVESGIPVDIFSTPKENWGMALVVRTGSANFNKRMMAAFIEKGMEGHAYGGVTVPGRPFQVACPTEQSVFDLLEWDFILPEDRNE